MTIYINGTSGISGVDGSAGTPALQGTDSNTGISFPAADTVAVNTGGTERSRVDSSGRLLVGTSSAAGRADFLQIQADSGTTTNGASILLRSGKATGTITTGDVLGQIRFSDSSGDIYATVKAEVDAATGSNDFPSRLVFSTTRDGASSPTIGMSLLNTGELRIGSTDQTKISTDPVHTIGDVSLATVQTNLARLVMQERSNNWISFKGGSGSHNGTISASGAGVSYGSNSDYRLKENITKIEGAIQKLKLAKPCQYNFIAFPDQRIDGFIAHELQEVVPSAVSGAKDAVNADGEPEYQTVDASKLVPLLTAALQEAIGRIEALEAEVAALKAQ